MSASKDQVRSPLWASHHVNSNLATDPATRCDRKAPCRQCTKANIKSCVYIQDNRTTLTEAPFEAEETQFLIFDQRSEALTQRDSKTASGAVLGTPACTSATTSLNAEDDDFEGRDLPNSLSSPKPSTVQSDQRLSIGLPRTGVMKLDTASFPHSYPLSSSSTQGTFVKGRFYGQSHWMSYAPLVCFPLISNIHHVN